MLKTHPQTYVSSKCQDKIKQLNQDVKSLNRLVTLMALRIVDLPHQASTAHHFNDLRLAQLEGRIGELERLTNRLAEENLWMRQIIFENTDMDIMASNSVGGSCNDE